MDDKARAGDQPSTSNAEGLSERRAAGVRRLGSLPLHPFLFVAASVFSVYASNLREVSFSDMTAALAAGLGAALVFFLLFGSALRGFGARAAILASIAIVASLFYVKLVASANGLVGGDLSSTAALPIMLAIVAGLVVVVARLRVDLTLTNAVLNGVAFALFVTPAWQVASYEWRTDSSSPFTAEAFDGERSELDGRSLVVDPATSKKAPDIYYFIFDRYGSESTLADHYGFDNSDLINFLKAKGFYVASNSHSNYLKTAHSLASTFHMDYLDFLAEKVGNTTDWHPIYDMLKDHRVARFLKSVGYTFVQMGGWWGPTQYNPYADENFSFGYSEFDYQYLQRTIIPPLLNAVAPASSYAQRLQWDNGQCYRVPRQIEKVKEIGRRGETTFVFTHVLLPHGPYVFGPDGRCLPYEEALKRDRRRDYVEQLQYANSLIKDFVSALLARDGAKPIIIIQADEGPFPKRYPSSRELSWRDATADELRVKTGILNAYYFPDRDYQNLHQTITPVNTFRILFNKYFRTNFERLPDRIYAFPNIYKIYDFFDVTDIVRGDSQ